MPDPQPIISPVAAGTTQPAARRPLERYVHPPSGASAGLSRRRLTSALLALVALINGGVIVWLWLHGGGISGVHSSADRWTSIGRITGLLAVYSALLQVLMLARLPWLERTVGFDRLTFWHRRNGKLCIYLVIAHVVLITLGYSLSDQITVFKEYSHFLSSYPGMITATVGTALMIGVVLSSLVIVRRRLPYEAWYFVHLSIYLGIVLSYLHQIPTGNEFTANKTQASYWIALYVVTLTLLLAFRVLHPAWQAWRYKLRVERVVQESPGVLSLYLGGRKLDRLHARAGQFFVWRFLTPGRWWQAHPFSLSAAPDGRSLRLTVKDVGGFTGGLCDIGPGTRVLAEGPFGTFTADRRRRQRVALIAGGIGITPLRALLEELSGEPGDIALIYRAMRDEDLVLAEEIEQLAGERGIELHYAVGDHRDPQAASLLSCEHLQALVPDVAARDIYLCGPPPMMKTTRAALLAAHVPRSQIHSERFDLAL